MSTVLDRDALEGSPLADLHLIAGQVGLDGYRRLRKADLVDAILAQQSGDDAAAAPADEAEEAPKSRRRRSRSRSKTEETTAAVEAADTADAEEPEEEPRRGRSRRRGSGGGGEPAEEKTVSGTLELQNNGSGFVRLNHPDQSDDDVYVSAAQIKRCELVSGDTVGGPVRAPRRSERFPSLVRVETINGKPADEVAGVGKGTRFDDLAAAFAAERIELGSDDPTVTAVEWLTPFGKGSRVVVCGPALAGKTELLRKLAGVLRGRDGLELTVVLAGARPEEVAEWGEGVTAVTLGASAEAQAQAVESAVESGRRVAARGGDAVVIVDALDALEPLAAVRALAAGRNLVEGGSLTVIAAASAPVAGATTLITLDAELTGLRRFPNVDLAASATMRPELLVGEAGAEKIAAARSEALAG